MKATQFEFRFRVLIMVVVIFVGFWSPWIEPLGDSLGMHGGFMGRVSLLEGLALEIARMGLVSFAVATPIVIVVVALIAAKGAALRIWGTAYLGSGVVNNTQMKAAEVMVAGPYRYVRNPLYLGSWGMVATICFLMPPTGALFTMVLLSVFLFRLILAEEAFLSAQIGQPYLDYLGAVPRLIPRLRTNLPRSEQQPRWLRAFAAEINPIGIFIVFAVLSWTYNNHVMIQGVLVSFGVSLVVRALLPQIRQTDTIPT